jgi:hypothetical protein
MSFIHYLFIGHFEDDGAVIRLVKGPHDSAYRPVVHHALDREVLKSVLGDVKGAPPDDVEFPDDWMMWLEDGYLVCDKYTRIPDAVDFVARVVERTGCEIYDVSAHAAIPLREWLAVAQTQEITRPPVTEKRSKDGTTAARKRQYKA